MRGEDTTDPTDYADPPLAWQAPAHDNGLVPKREQAVKRTRAVPASKIFLGAHQRADLIARQTRTISLSATAWSCLEPPSHFLPGYAAGVAQRLCGRESHFRPASHHDWPHQHT